MSYFQTTLFAASLCLEILVPLVVTSALFWTLIIPTAVNKMTLMSKAMAATLTIDCEEPGNRDLLAHALPRLTATRDNLQVLKGPLFKPYIMASNLALIVIVALLAAVMVMRLRLSTRQAFVVLVEIVAIYALVAMAQVHFIVNVAFKYAPKSKLELYNEVIDRLLASCFESDNSDNSTNSKEE